MQVSDSHGGVFVEGYLLIVYKTYRIGFFKSFARDGLFCLCEHLDLSSVLVRTRLSLSLSLFVCLCVCVRLCMSGEA